MTRCTNCGAELPQNAQFCPRCGTQAASVETPPAPAVSTPVYAAGKRPRVPWWLPPLIVVGLVVIAWAALAFFPFERDDEILDPEREEIIAETNTTYPTGTIVEVPANVPPPVPGVIQDPTATIVTPTATFAPTTTVPPPGFPAPSTAPPPASLPPPITRPPLPPPQTSTPSPQPEPPPPPATREPEPEPPPREPEPPPAPEPPEEPQGISESEAASRLRSYLIRTDQYGIPEDCLQIRSTGRDGDRYGFRAWNTCVGGGGSKLLGRWNVNANTGRIE
jgi:hypothetical protein